MPALARLKFDIMNQRSDGDVRERQAVARADFGLRSGKERITDLDPERSDNVAFLAVGIIQQGQARCPVGVIFNRRDPGRDVLLITLEIQNADIAPIPAAAMTY